MGKLYYDDPLAATWMAREFGVEYTRDHKHTHLLNPPKIYADASFLGKIYLTVKGACGEKATIHPDSLHIFEPQEGDAMLRPSGEPFISTGRRVIAAIHGNVIIQRNGKPFFWPKEGE